MLQHHSPLNCRQNDLQPIPSSTDQLYDAAAAAACYCCPTRLMMEFAPWCSCRLPQLVMSQKLCRGTGGGGGRAPPASLTTAHNVRTHTDTHEQITPTPTTTTTPHSALQFCSLAPPSCSLISARSLSTLAPVMSATFWPFLYRWNVGATCTHTEAATTTPAACCSAALLLTCAYVCVAPSPPHSVLTLLCCPVTVQNILNTDRAQCFRPWSAGPPVPSPL